jgi:uncharacterized membrane protein
MSEDMQTQRSSSADSAENPLADDGHQAALPAGPEAPDSLTELVQPSAPQTGMPEEGLRISTILGPLPARVPVQQTRNLNDAVHRILVIGLVISTVLLVVGLIMSLVQQGTLPTQVLPIGPAIAAALALKPIGLVSLGLITLLVTPIVRVIGSFTVFLWERDWLYAAATLTVLIVMAISVVAGHG